MVDAILRHGFAVRQRKARRMPRSRRQEITGIVVNRKASLGRRKVQAIRDEILRLAARPDAAQYELLSIWGRIYHARFVCPEQGQKLLDLATVVRLPKEGAPGRRPRLVRYEPCKRHRWN